jgi:hypothetical protein
MLTRTTILSLAAAAVVASAPAAIPAAPAMASAAAVTAVALPAAPAQPGANGGASGCTGFQHGAGWDVKCQDAGTTGSGSGSSAGVQTCTWHSDVNHFFPNATNFLPPAPKGFIYLVEVCGIQFFPPQLVANGGGGVTPAELAQQALQELQPPLPVPHTAPPRGQHGAVGLPEWYWVPRAQWAPVQARAAAGAVWAVVTATPQRLTVSPGSGLPAKACPGPGTAYSPSAPPSAACTYTYTASSAQLPGAAYQVTVTITWTAAWVGSGGTGGTLPALSTSATFPLQVAEGQALNTGGSG